jgi:hypothetical protein
MERKRSHSFRLSEECLDLLQEDAERLGLQRSHVIEMAARYFHESHGIDSFRREIQEIERTAGANTRASDLDPKKNTPLNVASNN